MESEERGGPFAPGAGVLCVFAKPPIPGLAKTRLAAEIGHPLAAKLSRAFLRDTWRLAQGLPWARPVLATTEAGAARAFGIDAEEWLQGPGDLGQRLERILRRALQTGAFAIAIGADTPGLPTRLLEQAHSALAVAQAVIGPSQDGGFYLIGLSCCPTGLFSGLPWGQENTFARTLARLRDRGLQTRVLPPWFDVDRRRDLEQFQSLLERGEIDAPETARMLARGYRGDET